MQESFSNSAGRHLQDAQILLKEQRWDNAVYLAAYLHFQKNYYSEDEDVPNSNDTEQPFFPIVVSYQESLRGDIALFSRRATPEELNRLSSLVKIMTDSPYQDMAKRLCILFGREFNTVAKLKV